MSLAHLPHPGYPERTDTGNQWIDLVQPAADLANMIAQTEFVPAEMRNKAGAITACILYGAELGLGPMQSLARIDIVKGRPAPRAELARALALGAGHEIWVDEQSNTKCKVSGRRRGSQQVQTVTWTLDDVRKAGIQSQMYTKYPRQMLLARASAELVRMMCPDVLGGIAQFAEEITDGDLLEPVVEPAKATTRRRQAPTPAVAAAPVAPGEPVVVDDDDGMPPLPDEIGSGPTPAQTRKMMACFNDLGIKDRADRLAFIAAVARPVGSSKDLTVEEAGTVIDALERCITEGIGFGFGTGIFEFLPVDAEMGEIIEADTTDTLL